MKKAYQFRIYPTKKQEIKLLGILDTCRHLYNNSLSDRKKQAELNRVKKDFQVFPWGKPEWISKNDQMLKLTETKTERQREVYTQVLQDAIKRVDKSFKNFFIGFGYPRFKGKNRYDSFTYPQLGFELDNEKINLSKIGSVRIFQHREIEGRIKTCTIKRDVDQWYAIFTSPLGCRGSGSPVLIVRGGSVPHLPIII